VADTLSFTKAVHFFDKILVQPPKEKSKNVESIDIDHKKKYNKQEE